MNSHITIAIAVIIAAFPLMPATRTTRASASTLLMLGTLSRLVSGSWAGAVESKPAPVRRWREAEGVECLFVVLVLPTR